MWQGILQLLPNLLVKMTRLCILQGKTYEGQFLRTNVTPLDPVQQGHCSNADTIFVPLLWVIGGQSRMEFMIALATRWVGSTTTNNSLHESLTISQVK